MTTFFPVNAYTKTYLYVYSLQSVKLPYQEIEYKQP